MSSLDRAVTDADAEADDMTVHVLWLSGGLGCDGESVAITSATSPSLEDLVLGTFPGMPTIVLHFPLLAYTYGEEFMQAFYDAEEGRIEHYVLVVEGAIGNEDINGDGYWSGFGVNRFDGQPITVNEWVNRLVPKASAVLAIGTCAAYGGIPAMKNNPTGAMGLPDHLGWDWRARNGLPVVCLPGCPAQPDNMTQILLELACYVAGTGPAPELDAQMRPVSMFGRTVREGCNRAGFTEQGKFADEHGADPRCLVKLGCKGPVVKCNVPVRGWTGGIGGCPNVGGICIACTMPGFPDRYTPFHDADPWGNASANVQKFTYGPVFRYFRRLNVEKKFDKEPEWRRPGRRLTSGYKPPWDEPDAAPPG